MGEGVGMQTGTVHSTSLAVSLRVYWTWETRPLEPTRDIGRRMVYPPPLRELKHTWSNMADV